MSTRLYSQAVKKDRGNISRFPTPWINGRRVVHSPTIPCSTASNAVLLCSKLSLLFFTAVNPNVHVAIQAAMRVYYTSGYCTIRRLRCIRPDALYCIHRKRCVLERTPCFHWTMSDEYCCSVSTWTCTLGFIYQHMQPLVNKLCTILLIGLMSNDHNAPKQSSSTISCGGACSY